MPQLRLVPEELEVTSFVPMPVRASEKREMAGAATVVYPKGTCAYQSCVYACASNTCPQLCI
jgi:hypothetical protein